MKGIHIYFARSRIVPRVCVSRAAVGGRAPGLPRPWLCGPRMPARHGPTGHVVRPCGFHGLTLIKKCFVGRSLADDPLKSLEAGDPGASPGPALCWRIPTCRDEPIVPGRRWEGAGQRSGIFLFPLAAVRGEGSPHHSLLPKHVGRAAIPHPKDGVCVIGLFFTFGE